MDFHDPEFSRNAVFREQFHRFWPVYGHVVKLEDYKRFIDIETDHILQQRHGKLNLMLKNAEATREDRSVCDDPASGETTPLPDDLLSTLTAMPDPWDDWTYPVQHPTFTDKDEEEAYSAMEEISKEVTQRLLEEEEETSANEEASEEAVF